MPYKFGEFCDGFGGAVDDGSCVAGACGEEVVLGLARLATELGLCFPSPEFKL